MVEIDEIEIWTDVNGYRNIYEISSHARIRRKRDKFMMKQGNNQGYYTIRLVKDKKSTLYLVHRLIALNFIENKDPEKFDIVDHIDGNK